MERVSNGRPLHGAFRAEEPLKRWTMKKRNTALKEFQHFEKITINKKAGFNFISEIYYCSRAGSNRLSRKIDQLILASMTPVRIQRMWILII
jgi:hypothetical protein